MNTLAIAIGLAVLVSLASARSYRSNQGLWDGLSNGWNSGRLNDRWNSGRLTGGWNSGHLGGGLIGGHRRYRRAAVGYGPVDTYSHLNSGLGRLNTWGISSGRRSNLGWRTGSRWSQRGY
ncbi:uncharacterized protein LOC143070900 [Mytilus galloprovincialis]|uniref:uncharacterized protein LOC143070900 n=1 Tax=Mytilus galloprovincialis TaxID=29158 RepID=UPI003F7C8260